MYLSYFVLQSGHFNYLSFILDQIYGIHNYYPMICGPAEQNLNSESSTYINIQNDTQTFIYCTDKLIYIPQLYDKNK